MKQLFHIVNFTDTDPSNFLALQVGERHLAFAVTNSNATQLKELAYCISQENISWTREELAGLIHRYPVLKNNFAGIKLCFDSPEAILFPEPVMEDQLLFPSLSGSGGIGQPVFQPISDWALTSHFDVPDQTMVFIQENFGNLPVKHPYGIQLKNISSTPAHGHILVDFRNEEFSVLALREKQVVLARTFSYSVPADVLYYLLKICHHAGFSQEEVIMEFSGLIEKDSGLFKELYQYFTHVTLKNASWVQNAEYPAHFFTSLNDLALCES